MTYSQARFEASASESTMDGMAFTNLKRAINHSLVSGSPAKPGKSLGWALVTGTSAIYNVFALSSFAYLRPLGQAAEAGS